MNRYCLIFVIILFPFIIVLKALASRSSQPTAEEQQQSVSDDSSNTISAEATAQDQQKIEVIKVSNHGKNIDDQIKEITGQNNNTRSLRSATDFIPYVLQLGRGDPTKMAEILTRASRSPASSDRTTEKGQINLHRAPRHPSETVKSVPEQLRP